MRFHNARQLAALFSLFIFLPACSKNLPGPYSNPAGPEDPYLSLVNQQWATSKLFATQNGMAVPMDFQKQSLVLSFDIGKKEITGHATITFKTDDAGLPYFLLRASGASAVLDGQAVALDEVQDPDGRNTWKVVSSAVTSGSDHVLELSYTLPSTEADFRDGGIGFFAGSSDLMVGNYFERYGPANFESDQFQMTLTMNMIGATHSHRLFTNGTSIVQNGDSWTVDFPAYFTSSSFFIHLTDGNYFLRQTTYAGMERDIPITVYSVDENEAQKAIESLPITMQELETAYGPYAHASFVAYITKAGGGMEYAGATVSSNGALSHELTHSWFARGVMPGEGSAGWIDEAIASWRDYGYQRNAPIERGATNMAYFSLFERFTPRNCYVAGRTLLAELDYRLAPLGFPLKSILSELFLTFRRKTITTLDFEKLLEEKTNVNLRPEFWKFVFGSSPYVSSDAISRGLLNLPISPMSSRNTDEPEPISFHPEPLKVEEIR